MGPASESPDVIREMILAGADIIRLNFSHGDPSWHVKAAGLVRMMAAELNREVGILVDIPGPKLRVLAGSQPKDVTAGDDIILAG